jgi:hypothetical protein
VLVGLQMNLASSEQSPDVVQGTGTQPDASVAVLGSQAHASLHTNPPDSLQRLRTQPYLMGNDASLVVEPASEVGSTAACAGSHFQ